MKQHEPCASRGECYHAKAARRRNELYGSPGTPEGRVKGASIGGHNGNYEDRVRAARRCNELYGNPGTPEGRAKGARRRNELYGNRSPGTPEGRIKGAHNGARAVSQKRPSWPEVWFYGLVLGNPVTALGFTAQQSDGHGIYDGAWIDQRIIAELDGGGHHAFRDRHAEDTQKDYLRRLDGDIVLRETDENVLFLKTLAILEEMA